MCITYQTFAARYAAYGGISRRHASLLNSYQDTLKLKQALYAYQVLNTQNI